MPNCSSSSGSLFAAFRLIEKSIRTERNSYVRVRSIFIYTYYIFFRWNDKANGGKSFKSTKMSVAIYCALICIKKEADAKEDEKKKNYLTYE